MNRQDKSLKLAELMGWGLATYGTKLPIEQQEQRIQTGSELLNDTPLKPYAEDDEGQFKAILLKFPEAVLAIGLANRVKISEGLD